MKALPFPRFSAGTRILGLVIGSISVDVVLLDETGTPLYRSYIRHHGQPKATFLRVKSRPST